MPGAFITPELLDSLDRELDAPIASGAYKRRVSVAFGGVFAASLVTFPLATVAARDLRPLLVGLLWFVAWLLLGARDQYVLGVTKTNAEHLAEEAGGKGNG